MTWILLQMTFSGKVLVSYSASCLYIFPENLQTTVLVMVLVVGEFFAGKKI